MASSEHVLVTGGAGMIGSNLVKRLTGAGGRVSVVDNLWRGKREYLFDSSGKAVIDMTRNFHERDLSTPGALDDLLGSVDYVYHLADIVAGIGYVFSNQGSIFRQNMLINSNVITSIKAHPVKGYIYVGTACSFPAHLQSGIDAVPLREEDEYPAAPESAYGWSKLMGEYEALLMEKETGIPVCVPILHNVYGAPCDFSKEKGQVIPSLIRKALRHPSEEFVVWGSGNQGRAFVHVNDIVDALVLAKGKGLGHKTIQIGPGECTTIREIAETIVKISGKRISIAYDTSKPEGDRGRRADYSKARKILGWEPKTKLYAGLQDLCNWVMEKERHEPC